jgi:hypothetical protein
MAEKRFSDKRYVLPFGRYVGSTEVEPPADEVLVGREGQRAYLIDLLISTGRRGAYLVTGHRGAGKTSFVKYCISEYEASVFSRFLRGNVGRGVWDRVLVILFWMSILVGALFATELVQFFVQSVNNSIGGGPVDLLQWLVLLPIGILLLYPCVYAKVVLESCLRASAQLKARKDDAKDDARDIKEDAIRWAGLLASILVFSLAIFIWLVPPFGRPAQGASLLIPLIGALYATVQAISFRRKDGSGGAGRIWFLIAVLLVVFGESLWLYRPLINANRWVGYIFQGNLALGLVFLGLGSILRGIDQRKRIELVEPLEGEDGWRRSTSALKDALRSGARWYIGFGCSALFVGSVVLLYTLHDEAWWMLVVPFVIPAVLPIAFSVLRGKMLPRQKSQTENNGAGKDWVFQSRPTWILIAKAFISILIALQLAQPVLSFFSSRYVAPLSVQFGISCHRESLCSASLPFSGRAQEDFWLASLLVFVVFFHFVEYEWIIRAFVRSREGQAFGAGGLAPWDDEGEPDARPEIKRRAHRSLAELTLPWETYKSWLPVLPISVNLGFDRLDHRRVIQTMLVGLRECYHRTFLAWNSSFANLGRFLGLLALIILTALVSRPIQAPKLVDDFPNKTYRVKAHGMLLDAPRMGAAAGREPGFGEKLWLTALKGYVVFSVPAPSHEDLLLFKLLPRGPNPGDVVYGKRAELTLIYIGMYHVLIFLLFLFFGHLVIHRMPLLPYKQNLRRIDDLLDSLSARTKVTSSLNLWGPARWVFSIFSDERIRETERDPVDPRTVELAFLQILDDVQKGGFSFPGAARHHLTMPAPEITFIFDELDKLGTRVDPMEETRDPAAPKQEIQIIHNERERSLKLRALLSDLKNILTSAPARFIFVGGRDLHDEWLADQTARLPLLTSIFNTEVYLPSLMTDQRDPDRALDTTDAQPETNSLDERIREYVSKQYLRALRLYRRSVRKRWLPSFGLPVETLAPERFVLAKRACPLPLVLDASTGTPAKDDQNFLLNDFLLFLTHRSMGNPKKLRDLLSSFIRPAEREFENNTVRWIGTPCRHVIKLGDVEIFRVQLLVTIYRHLAFAFEERMVKRDDKYAISIFYLTDFLFKFHRRAFSWSNLERVDDLAHIHRLPDLREVQEEIVTHFSERFLHRVINGIYSFRFRSDIAREVEYLSRRSPAEMAAFNFTLDESLSLKSEYLAAIEGSERNNPDLVAALGELYEFDQDFERARHQYRVAIDILDLDLKVGKKKDSRKAVYGIFDGKGDEAARIFLPWGVARLRLMLQIGMTFELERDLEQAEAEYRSARNLARALVRAFVGEVHQEIYDDAGKPERAGGSRGRRIHSLKHMNVLFQPMFSQAWLAEKFFGSIDTSVMLVERGLWEVRKTLPFVKESDVPATVEKWKDENGEAQEGYRIPAWERSHANFSLTLLQLHNKAGDLYFFKGRQPVTPSKIREELKLADASKERETDRETEGYLLRAHYHYALSLHDLRRYIRYRYLRSQEFSIAKNKKSRTLLGNALPDFLFRAAAGNINDMAEATLARISMFTLFKKVSTPGNGGAGRRRFDAYFGECLKWLTADDAWRGELGLENWFGEWAGATFYGEDLGKLVEFEGPNKADERLLMSLDLCRIGASFLEAGGYPEDAGRELLQVCETVTRYLWWGVAVERLGAVPDRNDGEKFPCLQRLKEEIRKWRTSDENGDALPMSGIFEAKLFWSGLVNLGIEVLEKIDTLFQQSRYSRRPGSAEEGSRYLVGGVIPVEALTLLCSLGLGAKNAQIVDVQNDRMEKLLHRWLGPQNSDFKESDYLGVLRKSVQRHNYPLINRLNGMKVLIDNLVLKKRDQSTAEEEKEDFSQALVWTLELLDLNEQFAAPLHFTPFHSGTTCALVWLWGAQRFAIKENWSVLDRIHRAAQQDLANSEEMYTMRRSYYEAIRGLYYLYDDFNDRQIHYNHAIQMAGAELGALLKHLVGKTDELRREPEKTVEPQPPSSRPQSLDEVEPRRAAGG